MKELIAWIILVLFGAEHTDVTVSDKGEVTVVTTTKKEELPVKETEKKEIIPPITPVKETEKKEIIPPITPVKKKTYVGKIHYDRLFRRYGKMYMPFIDWKWFKAQAMQESGLNPNAVSIAGAQGLMQAMPLTFKDWENEIWDGVTSDPFNPEKSIQGGIYYMYRLNRIWKNDRKAMESLKLGFVSYNAGAGNILRAQKKAGGVRDFEGIMASLHLVTGNRHAKETRGYYPRIKKHYTKIKLQ